MQLSALEVVAGDRREVVLKVQKNGGVGEGVRRSESKSTVWTWAH
jgi:hypothetical protein